MKVKFIILFLFSVFILSNNVFSVESLNLVDESRLQEKIKAVEEAKNLDETTKTQLLESYAKTLEYLKIIQSSIEKSDFYYNARHNLPKQISLLEKKLIKQKEQSTNRQSQSDAQILETIKNISLSDLEQQSVSESIKFDSVFIKNSELSQSLTSESQSLAELRNNIINANATLQLKLEEKLLISEDDPADHKQASQWRIDAHIGSLRSQIKMWDQQLLSQPVRLQLLKIEKQLSDFELNEQQVTINLIQKKIDLKRGVELKKTQATILAEQINAKGKHPLIQSLAQSNTQLSEQLTRKSEELSLLEAQDDEVYMATKALNMEQANTKKKLDIAGLNQILGHVLYEQKKALPNRKRYEKNIKKRQQLISQSGLDNLKYQEEFEEIKNKDSYLKELLSDIPAETQVLIHDNLMELINTRYKLLEKAISIDEKYLKAIEEIDFAERQYVEVVAAYSDFLDEHLFWLRNAPLLNMQNLKTLPEQIVLFLAPDKWLTFVNDFITMLATSLYVLPSLFFIIIFHFNKGRIKKLIVDTGLKTKRISTDTLWHTLKAFVYTLLLATPLPIFLNIVSWQITSIADVSKFTYSIALGMKYITLPLFWLQTFRYMCLPGGVAESHFKWSRKLIIGLRNEMSRLMLTFLPVLFITALLISKGESSLNDGLGRISLILTLFTFAIFFYRLMKPQKGLLNSIAQDNPDSFFARYQTLLFVTGLLSIVALMGLTVFGYVYTAGQMTASLIFTLWLIFAMVILQQMSVRWLLLARRRYALQKAYEKRQARIKKASEDGDEHDVAEHAIDFDEPEIDMLTLSEESNQLLNIVLLIIGVAGLSTIWSDVVPALGIFDKFILWHHTGIIDGAEVILPVTLWDVSLAVLVLILTIVSAGRLPAIIEILLIQSASFSSGSRYTITTLVNYSIIGLGFFTIFNMLGAEWAKLQWLFAALSVGIGFGLQEIVANFISGIIILFERPIRVGDYVSVGDNEGIVSKIQIRATTIMTRDRKELLVPNKEFITGQLLNWSLSDPTARLIIPVGVAYGSDIPLARKLLIIAAEQNERVLTDPAPQVLFYNFGDNTLDLQLRCFIGDVDFRLRTMSEINEAINAKFNAAGINIAFPQRDVHLDIKQPIDIVINKKV